jgi:cell division protein FtsB
MSGPERGRGGRQAQGGSNRGFEEGRQEGRQEGGTAAKAAKAASRLAGRAVALTAVAVCAAFAVLNLYPVLREFYIADRAHARLVAEHAAIEQRNDRIREQIASLQTPEGIEDRAREQFGWTKPGEVAVNITGLTVSESSTMLPEAIDAAKIELESDWWTDFLDFLFAVEPAKPAEEDYDPFMHR